MANDAERDSWSGTLFIAAERQTADDQQRLFAELYDELHRLATKKLRHQSGLAISPTTLLHETYLGLSKSNARFPDRERFLAYASRVMRNLVIDFVRRRQAQKRGSGFQLTELKEELVGDQSIQGPDADKLAKLSEALDELGKVDADLAELVDLKYFCGFSVAEIAALRGVSDRTVERDWHKARTVLYNALSEAAAI